MVPVHIEAKVQIMQGQPARLVGQSTTFLPESTAHMHMCSVIISMREVFPCSQVVLRSDTVDENRDGLSLLSLPSMYLSR